MLFGGSLVAWLHTRQQGGTYEQTADTITQSYLQDMITENIVVSTEMKDNTTTEEQQELRYSGDIDCVLVIPAIHMERIVISGGDMDFNLERHLFVSIPTDVSYGTGSYIIGGHQSWNYGYSMNRLQELQVGDVIYIVKDGRTDTYKVTEIAKEQWDIASEDYGADTNKLAIYTCMRQKERPKPYLVVRAVKEEN